MLNKKFVYMFSEGDASLKDILGEKGANISEMVKLQLPVSPGFTITTEACNEYFKNPNFLEEIKPEIEDGIAELEEITGKKFGNNKNPLLVSIRSGSPISMPGMMDTVLNVGINEENIQNIIKLTKNERFAYDTYRRFIQMYSDVVIGIDGELFENILTEIKDSISHNATDTDLTVSHLKIIIERFKELYKEMIGLEFPQDPKEHLYSTIEAVFNSFDRPRAKYFRRINKIPDSIGTAVSIQEMVFGNYSSNSMTGVAVTRDPSTGEKKYIGEYLTNAQGEDVLSGMRTPYKLHDMKGQFPEVYEKLKSHMKRLETYYKDIQEIEFTVQDGKLFIYQTRKAYRSAAAEVKIAIDMMHEGLLTRRQTLLRVEPLKLNKLLFERIDENAKCDIVTKAINASPGAVTGQVVFETEDVERWVNQKKRVILVRPEMKPDDVLGLALAEGILTVRGGKTSHVAVVARGLGKPAVCGVSKMFIDLPNKTFNIGFRKFYEGDIITIDGSSGLIVSGEAPLIEPEISKEFGELMNLADQIRTLGIRANADTPQMAIDAISNGAEGIGLIRTEQIFPASIIQEIFLARSSEERNKILANFKPILKDSFKQIFQIMRNRPITVRLMDPPLNEFLPNYRDLEIDIGILRYRLKNGENVKKQLKEKENLQSLVQQHVETNPMLGFRGCRIETRWPEINKTICESLFEAACEVKIQDIQVHPEIIIPLVGFSSEIIGIKEKIYKILDRTKRNYDVKLHCRIGTIIEVPRSALTANEIAAESDFLSFGTNDLTQMALAFSRDDVEGSFLQKYLEKGILQQDPFEVIDRKGPGKLIELAIKNARKIKKSIETGVCGEHSANPESIEFFHRIGVNYVSCSAFQIPIAKLAAAQAQIRYPKRTKTKTKSSKKGGKKTSKKSKK